MVSARHSLVPHRAFIMTRVELPREQRGTRGNKLNSYTSDLYIPYKRHKHITKTSRREKRILYVLHAKPDIFSRLL